MTGLPNVLASRYATPELAGIWSPEHKVVLERRLWIAVLKAQQELGVEVPEGVERIHIDGAHHRTDIAAAVVEERAK